MSGLTKEEIKQAVVDGINEGIDSKLGDMFVNRQEHFLDHQYIRQMKEAGHHEDHEFVKGTRKNVGKVKTGFFVVLGASLATAVGWGVIHMISSGIGN